MDNTSSMSTNQKWVLASMSSGFLLENMDVMFLSFSLSEIIAQMHISSAAGGWIGTFTNLGMFFGGALFGLLGDRIGRVKTFDLSFCHRDWLNLLCPQHHRPLRSPLLSRDRGRR
ncbi:permease of the major facilitator superfamily [Lactobacillus delbrueckii subsp. jakobsenii ZN7a-9 = DSM 26046]|nr:permease of the major facilitator superfamily [Lactobacillus delbrueckii subsp. jakobsenii ZN7a-9 = DSM 26046]TDG62590.1 hypothetical protein C5L19_001667 [Lactobacillus delbrueckii subsp. jakobsenii]